MASPEGSSLYALQSNVDELQALDQRSVAERTGLDLQDRRVAYGHAEDRHRAERVLADHLCPDVVHPDFRYC